MLKLLLGDPNAGKLKRYQPIVSDINLLEEEIAPLSDDELRGLTGEFRQKLEQVAGNAAKERALPAYLNALTDRGVHVATVNDYLARHPPHSSSRPQKKDHRAAEVGKQYGRGILE